MAGVLFSVFVTILIAGWLWFYVVRPILEDYNIIQDSESVNDNAPAPPVVMSRSEPDEARTDSDERTDAATDGDLNACPMLRVDRSKEGLLRVLVYNGWSTTDIRAVVKGANDQISAAVQAAKESDGDDILITPFAGRRTRASYYDDPKLEYRPPPN